ncbi:shikimate kinase [Luminiphilus sp.]|nr:shikimate kinase [Luminiphilus sp.]
MRTRPHSLTPVGRERFDLTERRTRISARHTVGSMDYHCTMTAIETIKEYHPLFVEGMGGYDTRDPALVADGVVASIRAHWEKRPPRKPPLLIIQGDPLEPRGISAITPRVASILDIGRGLIVLDEGIADHHSLNADRDNVTFETRYSEDVAELERYRPGSVAEVERAVDSLLIEKNGRRARLGKPPLAEYYRIFALLQEVSKGAFGALCGEITLVHTSEEIGEFSVTSFYKVGVDLGLMSPACIAPFLGPLTTKYGA